MRKLLWVVAAALPCAGPLVPIPQAGATTQAGTPTGTWATYKGRFIDLSRDWGTAHACAVLSVTDIRCFDSQGELERTLNRAHVSTTSGAQLRPLTIDAYCLNRSDLWLILYDTSNFGGNSVSFRDTGTWFNLSSYSFDNVTSSWKNNTYCDATAAQNADGGGSLLTLAARSQATSMPTGWDDVISSVEISAA